MTSLFPREAPLFINTKKTLLPGYSLLRCKSSPDPLFVFYGRIAKQNNQPLAAGVFNLVLFTELLRPLAILHELRWSGSSGTFLIADMRAGCAKVAGRPGGKSWPVFAALLQFDPEDGTLQMQREEG